MATSASKVEHGNFGLHSIGEGMSGRGTASVIVSGTLHITTVYRVMQMRCIHADVC
jgi:hypothetical protein